MGSCGLAVVKYFVSRLIFGAPVAPLSFFSGHKIRYQIKCMAMILQYSGLKMDF